MKKISIIIPNYNGEKYLKRCLDSVVNQKYSQKEIIVIDDGSTDDSIEIIKNYGENIKLIKAKHCGPNLARKAGIDAATGDYILFVDSDDYIEKGTLQKIAEEFEENDVDVIRFNYRNTKTNTIMNPILKHGKKKIIGKKGIFSILFTTYSLNSLWCQAYRKELLNSVEAFSTTMKFGEDFIANLEIHQNTKKMLILNGEPLYNYCENQESTTRKITRESIINNISDRITVSRRALELASKMNIKKKRAGFVQLKMIRDSIIALTRLASYTKQEFMEDFERVLPKGIFSDFAFGDMSIPEKIKYGKIIKAIHNSDYEKIWKYFDNFRSLRKKVKKIKDSDPLKNSASAVVGNVINILVKFALQKIFLNSLGLEYSGLNGILTNIIAALNIAELGVGIAVTYNMYEPIKKKQVETVRALMKFYKKAYDVIALIVVFAGVAVLPFLHLIVRDEISGTNIHFAYLLALFGAASSYLLSYRQSLLYAMQNGRITTNIQTIGNVIIAGLQATLLIFTKNYYLYLVAKIVIQLLENIFLYRIARHKYPEYCEKATSELDKGIEKDIYKKMRALFVHKASSFVIFGTDNIIISSFINVATVGLYSNYHMIISALETIFAQAIKALTPTVGHLLVDKDQAKNYKVFKKIRNINFLMAMASSVGLMALADLFVRLWIGEEYILPGYTLTILTVVHFQRVMRESFAVFKEAAGIYHEDRFVPVIESAINILTSVALVIWIGLPGVFIGTFLSSLVLWCYSYPKYIYKKLFGRTYKQYAAELLLHVIIFITVLVITLFVKNILF